MTKPKAKRITLYVDEAEYLKLRARFILVGKSISSWVREMIQKKLGETSSEEV